MLYRPLFGCHNKRAYISFLLSKFVVNDVRCPSAILKYIFRKEHSRSCVSTRLLVEHINADGLITTNKYYAILFDYNRCNNSLE